MAYLEIIGMGIPFFVIIGVVLWLSFRGWPARKRYLHERTLAARENARRVREEQQRLREQRRQ